MRKGNGKNLRLVRLVRLAKGERGSKAKEDYLVDQAGDAGMDVWPSAL